jgi:hypothetical protein
MTTNWVEVNGKGNLYKMTAKLKEKITCQLHGSETNSYNLPPPDPPCFSLVTVGFLSGIFSPNRDDF